MSCLGVLFKFMRLTIYAQYTEQGLKILDVTCNQFRGQTPESSSEIAQACQMKFGTKFKIFDKIDVNGENATYPKSEKPEDKANYVFKDLLLKLASISEKRGCSDIRWHFAKFLVNRNGEVVARFAPSAKPSEIKQDIRALQ
ncbi:glutathione peroxidase [Neisseria yangbaofengii]|uniref:glutathione peroxidase n=1 Tax=Neisseria yangbaofengii TaxID=2709396 RepID=UPI0013EB0A53|nr:glutathione peroxidase [Neisseria yangbaofengii]